MAGGLFGSFSLGNESDRSLENGSFAGILYGSTVWILFRAACELPSIR